MALPTQPKTAMVPYRASETSQSGPPGGHDDTMRFYAETLGLPDTAFVLLRDLIHERLGLFFDNGKRDMLADKLSYRAVECGMSSFLDYYYLLKYDESAREEWARVSDALAVMETFFWREADQFRALVDQVVPRFFATPRAEPLRIWCAACCTGEEPLSIAMALRESGWLQRAPIEIVGSDASAAAIARARAGVYRERSFRTLPVELRERYFTAAGDGWRIAPELHARVRFDAVNLMDPAEAGRLAGAHVVFCRNVFLYFSQDAIRKTVRFFAERMAPPAHLFVGAAESLLKLTNEFELQEINGAFVYVKM